MPLRTHRPGAPSRRRPPIGTLSFLRPPRRHEEEQRLFLERVRQEPRLRREYRGSLLFQMLVVGALLLALLVLLVQAAIAVRMVQSPALAPLRWFLPGVVGVLALLVLRRFLRLLSDYRSMRGE